MKRSASDLLMDALLGSDGDDRSPPLQSLEELLLPAALGFTFGDRQDGTGGGLLSGVSQMLSQNPPPKHSTISMYMESQSSMCAGTPTSSLKPTAIVNRALGEMSGSDQSDEESFETEGGSFEQSRHVTDIKRMRRMVSNRESARRSRKRKQAHLADLELQVDQLRGENASLFKQLTDANQEYAEAATNNRILKSNVEGLRIQVKMAEDLFTRGTSACSLNHLLQNNVGSPQFLNPQQPPPRASPDFLPAIGFQGDDSFIDIPSVGQVENIRLENGGSRVHSEVANCGTNIWPCESNVNTMPTK